MNTLDELSKLAYDLFLIDYADKEPQQFTIPLNAVPASRPRVYHNKGVGYGKKYTHFMKHAVGPCNTFDGRKTSRPVACLVEHVVERTKKFKYDYPDGDLDNYIKGPLDAMVKSGRFFEDDVQVVFMISFKRYTNDNEKGAVHVTWFDFDA